MRNYIAVLLFVFLSSAVFADKIEITRIEMKRDRGYDYLDIYTKGNVEAKGLLLEDKLFLDFPNTEIAKKIEVLKRKSSRIKDLQVEMKDEKTARIILFLKKEIDYDVVNVFGRDKSVIEIGDRLDNIFTFQMAWEKNQGRKKGQPLKPVKLEPLTTGKDFSLRGKTIILDPGHGGDDPGAFPAGCSVPEKILTLRTAQLAAKLLRERGATVFMTRDEDRRSNLKDVIEFANKTPADIFISVHYNSTNSGEIAGTETYFYNPASRKFAETMHEAIVRGIKRKDRGLHRTPFFVVKNASMPSVLLEPVYLTSREEREMVASSEFQDELALDIVKGVKNYFRNSTR